MRTKLTGEVNRVITDYVDGTSDDTFYLVDEEGPHEIEFHSQEEADACPLNCRVEIEVEDAPPDEPCAVCHVNPIEGEVLEDPGTHKDVGLFRVVPEGTVIDDEMWDWVRLSAKRLRDVYVEVAQGRWTVEVTPYITASNCSGSLYGSCWNLFNELGWLEKHWYWHGWGGFSGTICGHATLGGRKAWSFCGDRTKWHEQGHNLGAHHSGTKSATGVVVEYGDNSCFMGNTARSGLNAAMRVALGLHNPNATVRVTGSRKFFLAPVEFRDRDLRAGEVQYIEIDSIPHYYVISRRDWVRPYTPPTHVSPKDSIFIHQASSYNFRARPEWLTPVLRPGGERVLESGHKVVLRRMQGAIAEVDVIPPGQSAPAPAPFPAAEVPANAGVDVQDVAGRLWYDPEVVGQGIDVIYSGNELVVLWYTFAAESIMGADPKRIWYICQGPIVDGVAHLKVISTSGGTFNNPSTAVKTEVGKAYLTFSDHDHGFFDFDIANYGRGHIPLTRLT